VNAPALVGLKPVRGSLRLVGMRLALSGLAALPAILAARGALEDAVGRRSFFADAPDPLPLLPTIAMLGELGPAWAAMVVGAAVAWLANLMLTAAAVEILDPRRPAYRVRLSRAMIDTGSRLFFVYLRVALLALVVLGIGGRLIGLAFDGLADHGKLAGWTARSLLLTLPIARIVSLLAWAGVVGLLAWWCRVFAAAEGRRYVRRIAFAVPGIWRLFPLQAFLLQWAISIVSVVFGAMVLFGWRQSAAGAGGWIALWVAVLLLQAGLWHWRMRTSCLIWATRDLDEFRRLPDEPWHVFRRLRDRLRRRRAHDSRPPRSTTDGAPRAGSFENG